MTYTRPNVFGLASDWADPILWYARAVADMKTRPIQMTTSWRFYAGIHGIDEQLWQLYGYLTPGEPMPSSADVKRYWKQCQHGSWYFLPWHRGYLLAFEANVRETVKALGGPADWTLPYWNYFKANQAVLPPAFASPDWPDGKGNNPLFVAQRYGPYNDGNVYVPMDRVNLNIMGDPNFTGTAGGGDVGFGGVDTGFSHDGATPGGLEAQPHGNVHGAIGGANPTNANLPGLMSDPDTAGLDPIFWLHHANIDRLWQIWNMNPPTDANPTDPNWLKGPANVGDRGFSMPMPDGTNFDYIPADLTDLGKLGYTYDDLSPVTPAAPSTARLLRLGATEATAKRIQGVIAMAPPGNPELMGANTAALKIVGQVAETSVQLAPAVQNRTFLSMTKAASGEAPDRVYLNLENVRGLADGTALRVYVDVPSSAKPVEYPEQLAGTVTLFGVRKATAADGEHAGQGLNFVLDITGIVDAIHLTGTFDVGKLDVRIVPVAPVSESAQITIGRISIYRQGR